jgi:uncharacterized Tic20 family protein
MADAPLSPPLPPQPGQPAVPPPPGYAVPGQPASATPQGQPGYAPPPAQPGYAAPPAQPGYAVPVAQPGYAAPPAQPGYAVPAPQPGSAPPPAAYPHAYARPATGSVAWGLGFLAFVPIPVVSMIIAGIAMASAYGAQRRNGPVAEGNARNAANWGLTVIAVTIVSFTLTAVFAALFGETSRGFLPIGAPILIWAALCVAHVVVIIIGVVKAGKGQVFENRIAIPFIRR